jgi:hypothetical protein
MDGSWRDMIDAILSCNLCTYIIFLCREPVLISCHQGPTDVVAAYFTTTQASLSARAGRLATQARFRGCSADRQTWRVA